VWVVDKTIMSREKIAKFWNAIGEPEMIDYKQFDKVKSDGWETAYYDVPASIKDVDDLIMHFQLNWHMANILKACLRYGKKEGVTKEYDLNKIDFMSKREREHIEDA